MGSPLVSFPITLDKERRVKFTVNALIDFEAEIGYPLSKMQERSEKEGFGLKHIRAWLWAGLKHEDPSLTVEQAGDLIQLADGDTFERKLATVMEVINRAMGELGVDQADAEKN